MGRLRQIARAIWAQARRYRVSIWIVVFTAVTLYALIDSHRALTRIDRLVAAEAREDVREDAQACIDSWERTAGSRAAIAASVYGVVDLAFAVGFEDDAATQEQIRNAAVPIIRRAQEELASPTCDRDRALERLKEGAP